MRTQRFRNPVEASESTVEAGLPKRGEARSLAPIPWPCGMANADLRPAHSMLRSSFDSTKAECEHPQPKAAYYIFTVTIEPDGYRDEMDVRAGNF